MENQLQFRISSGLKNIIGRDLITDDFIAIFELVKNSYDAHATKVLIEFENINTSKAIIRITDNGKGMNYDDLINKWLFVAYSAKKDGTEDIDYRNKIQSKTFYAGAKGIGRFSCDKLGSKLILITKKDEENSKTEKIQVDWQNFEEDTKDEFINIGVNHSTLSENPSIFESGTLLEISNIRNDSEWNYEKLIRLKNSLSKLINPFESNEERDFEIEIKADDYLEYDKKQESSNKKINGLVTNNLLNILNEKTIKIRSEISSNGKKLKTVITDNGIWLFTVISNNISYPLLRDIFVELFYLNRSAKNKFTRTMGIRNTEYGSVFLYKNGIRVYPYGEPGADPFELDKRQQARLGDRLGTQQLIGRIEISGNNEDFKETTSRDGGLIKNQAYTELLEYFIDVIERLEFFWLSIYKYGIDTKGYIENDNLELKIIKSILKINSSENDLKIDYNPNLISLITDAQNDNENALTLIKSIEKIAEQSQNPTLFTKISKIKKALEDALTIADIAEEEIKEKDKELQEQEKQNLFLKALKSQDFTELVSLMHHIGISSGIISNHLQILTYKIENNLPMNNEDLRRSISILNLENQKILSISRFATKANFKLNAENQRLDLVEFIVQYINNVALSYLTGISIDFKVQNHTTFLTTFKPLELTMILDNLINNSKKAKATKIKIEIEKHNQNLFVYFKDNGIGISKSNKNKVFKFGFTTTGGSGLGLTHIKETLEKIGAKIELLENDDDFTVFLLSFK
ncbi:MAG: ATP-binding protein [Aequorivita sp.]|nr:ATP-binding protein [Aequorivita sp.]MBP41567.1 ATP-binding protein [Aequorivita sp.]HBC05013.1 ATP-binding protein [Aequorivita sp.]|tara:strand:+ start:6202 stop:8445 length:2244 start_codon:yes stop_codon:yes gene_type:complete